MKVRIKLKEMPSDLVPGLQWYDPESGLFYQAVFEQNTPMGWVEVPVIKDDKDETK